MKPKASIRATSGSKPSRTQGPETPAPPAPPPSDSPLLLVMDSSLIQVPQTLSLIHSTRPEGPKKSPDGYSPSKVSSSYLTRKTSLQNSQDGTANPTDTPT